MQQNLFMGDFIMGQKFIMGDVYYGKCLLWETCIYEFHSPLGGQG